MPMGDAGVPCIHEHEHWPNCSMHIERQRSFLEELATFEREVSQRCKERSRIRDNTSVPNASADENSCLKGLEVHSVPPRLLNDTDFMEEDSFANHSKMSRHRQKHVDGPVLPHSILIARSVSRSEFTNNAAAMQAYWKEWDNLERKGVWNWDILAEWDDVAEQARRDQSEIHFGYLFGIMVEKGSEFPVGDERRYFKYRVVFQGNQVKDQNWEVAMFNGMASTPATLEASRIADIYSCFKGHSMQSRDVEQAYLQAKMEGPPVYIMLPRELWTEKMKGMRCPVFKLERALYGHKHSGAYWQKFCHTQCLKAGFDLISENWPGVYYNKSNHLLLIVYVDDMKMAGPTEAMEEAWRALGQNITLEKPKGDCGDSMTFLGCEAIHRTEVINDRRSGLFDTIYRINSGRPWPSTKRE